MKTKEELNTLKEEVETVSKKLRALSDDELEKVIGGCGAGIDNFDNGVSEIIKKLFETIKKAKEKAEVQ